jgi:aldehyde dehydrogenase (NAD+)
MAVALVEGNTVVWKPAEQTPYCGEVVAEMFAKAGIPDGVFNLVQGQGPVGEQIVEDDRPATILFTGSAAVGHAIQDSVADRSGVRAACEMGGKNAIVVTANADLDLAIHSAIVSSFKTTGQRCVSTERLIVHTDVYDEFRDRFVEVAERIAVDDPLSGDAFMGPLVDAHQVESFQRYNALAREEATNVLVDRAELDPAEIPPDHVEGHWVGPVVYEMDASDQADHRLLNEEVFGPHVALIEYEGDIERAVELQNDTPYGLAGAIVSEDYRELHYYRDHAELGLAYGNLPSIGAEVQLPFGGVKRSGNGWPSAREIIEAVTDRTAWTLNNDRDVELAQGLSADIATRE